MVDLGNVWLWVRLVHESCSKGRVDSPSYFLDLMWAQAFGLALTPITYEFGLIGDNAYLSANLSTAFSAGLTAGAFSWGLLVDIVGKRSRVYTRFGQPAYNLVRSLVGFQRHLLHCLRLRTLPWG